MRNGQVEETTKIRRLKKELKLKEFQFNSIFEFSETIYSSFDVNNVVRIYFSTLMGQLGVSRAFFYDSENHLFEKRGFKPSEEEIKTVSKNLEKLGSDWFFLKTADLDPGAKEFLEPDAKELKELKALLIAKKIHCLVNISDSEKRTAVLGMGARFTQKELTNENVEYAFFVSRFAMSAIENAILINRLIETKRVEHEMKIARDIQLSLLPQSVPELENFELGVIYQPINEVGGDYYDILKEWKGALPVLIADVEGKGLSAALLAASSQAILHSLNQLYFFDPGKFIAKANAMIYEFTRGNRFITLFWMLVEDEKRSITYVNAGHAAPFLISGDRITRLEKGGFLTGFVDTAQYETETLELAPGDIIAAFTDGVSEVENNEDEEFGEDGIVDFIKKNRHLPARQMADALFDAITDFSEGKRFRDDFTLIILRVK